MLQLISLLVENKPGSLMRVTGVLAARGYNIESLTVARTLDPETSRMSIVVDIDSTQRAQGVLIYESQRPPKTYPQLGEVSGGDHSVPLHGVRVDWAGVSNPRCPLLGAAVRPQR